jgi:hypothetical protein
MAKEIGPVMEKGAAWFDLSTNSPDCVRRIHASLPDIRFSMRH